MDPPNSPRHAFADEGRVGDAGDGIDGVATGLRARWLLDAMSDMVGLLSPHGAVLELNACGLELAALTRSEAVGRKLWELDAWYRSEAARRRAHLAVVRATIRDAPTRLELSLGHPESEPRPFDIVLTPIHDKRGQITLLVLEGRDVAEMRTAEGAAIRHNAELQELADNLSETDAQRRAFITDISHELKTPLSITIGVLDRTLNDWVVPAPARRDILTARRYAQSMQAQVDQLLTAAQLEAGRLELVLVPCDLAALVRRVAAGFESVAGAHGVSLEVDTSPSVIVVADPQRVASAITNLVSNALNATPREGCVRVELRERRGKARLEVSDTGAGVPTQLREAIFERFRQGDGRRAGGAGIGLALVNEIVALHGGSVSIDKSPTGGGLFRLEFALAPAGAAAATLPDIGAVVRPSRERLRTQLSRRASAARRPSEEPSAHPRVLLVEDDLDLVLHLTHQLSSRYAVRHVASAEHALRELQRSPHDVVVTDVGLPGISGEALIELLRSQPDHDRTEIMALSGSTDPELGERLLRLGAQDFMRKPINERELVARIDGIFARRAQEQTVRETARLAEASMEQAALGVGLLEVDGRWLRANQALCAMLGYTELELRQLTLDELTAPEDVGVERPYLEAALDGQSRGFQVEKRLRRADGEYVWLLLSVAAISRKGRPPLLVVHVNDAGERRAAQDALRRLQVYDELTGVLRRREFERRLGRHIRRARGAGALLLVDIDDFGSLNRQVGRAAADRVLRAVAAALRAAAPNGAPVGRIDGDRFAILVARTDKVHADAVAAAVAAAVGDRAISVNGTTTRVSVRVGGVILSSDSSVDTALAAAEEALLRAQRTGSRCLTTPAPRAARTAGGGTASARTR